MNKRDGGVFLRSFFSFFFPSLSCLCLFVFLSTEASVKGEKGRSTLPSLNQKTLEKKKRSRSALPSLNQKDLKKKKRALSLRRTGFITEMMNKRLNRVYSFIKKSEYDKALSLLSRMEKVSKNRPFELAQVYQQKASVYLQKDNHKQAIFYYEKALSLETLNLKLTSFILFQLAHIYSMERRYIESLKILGEWLYYEGSPSAQAYILQASNYFELGYKEKALIPLEKALQFPQAKKNKGWLQFAAALNYELKRYKKAAVILRDLTIFFPEVKMHWMQLVGCYIQLGSLRKALSILEMAYKLGHLSKEGDILNLVSLYLDQGIPLKAAKLLEKELKLKRVKENKQNLEILASSFIEAEEQEKALPVLGKAASFSGDGKAYFYQAQLYMDQEDWKKADRALKRSLSKGKLKNKNEVYLSFGIVKYRMNQLDEAEKFFNQALNGKKSKSQAAKWLTYLSSRP